MNIFIFRRDFRIYDNKGLNYADKHFKNIIPIFIFTPEQVVKNSFKSDNAIQFMIESLKDLNRNLKKKKSKLHIFQGENIKILEKIIKSIDVENIIFNMDYTPYAKKRDNQIEKFCKKNKIKCIKIEDYLLSEIGELNKKDGDPYTIYTPFKNKGLKLKVDKPQKKSIKNLTKVNFDFEKDYIKHKINKNILVKGGRKEAKKILKKIKNQKNYNNDRKT